MPFYTPGISQCSLCNGVIAHRDEVFGTWGVFSAEPELFVHCDALMHYSCFAAWPRREPFARAYFDFWADEERTNRYWARAYLDDRVLVTVNPFNGTDGEVRLLLSRVPCEARVDLEHWERWLLAPETSIGRRLHPLVIEEFRVALPALRAALPTADAVVQAVDAESKGWTRKASEDP